MDNEIVKYEETYSALAMAKTGDLNEVVKANFGDGGIKPSDLPRLKVPSGGGTIWQVPSLTGNTGVEKLTGIILYWQDVRTYWLDPNVTGTPPDCYSMDCKAGNPDDGVPNVNGTCKTCPQAQFGSSLKGDGQACSEKRLLYLLLPDRALPVSLNIPPTSLKKIRSFFLTLASFAKPYWQVEVSLKLVPAKSKSGQDYAQVEAEIANVLPADGLEALGAYREALLPALQAAMQEDVQAAAVDL